MTSAETAHPSSIYGPVRSWRFGRSLGVDLILRSSICSFNCVYCQLGRIQEVTTRQEVYVPTERVAADLADVDWDGVDVVTISGSGEPTLALNLDEVIALLRERGGRPVHVLTNATLLEDPATRARLASADVVACKLDAATDDTLRRFNRPAPGITLDRITRGIAALLAEDFPGKVAIQTMFMAMNRHEAPELARLIRQLGPDELHLNTPRRPYPRAWNIASRGAHGEQLPVETVSLDILEPAEAHEIEAIMRRENPVLPILSVYDPKGD